jgi:hypothetical protein
VSYVDSLLANGEEIVYRTKKHWIAPAFSTITGTLLTIGGLAALFGQLFTDNRFLNGLLLWGGLGALLIGLVLLVNAAVKWWAQFYFVTNQKVMKVEGLLRKSTSGSALEKINDITMEEPLLGRWLGYGTVRVLTAADESNLHYTFMRKPLEFRKAPPRPSLRPLPHPRARRSPTRSRAWPGCATAGPSPPRSSRRRRPSSSTGCSPAYGDRRRRVQAAASSSPPGACRRYSIRSCSLEKRPTQNSTTSGTSTYPPQLSGIGIGSSEPKCSARAA